MMRSLNTQTWALAVVGLAAVAIIGVAMSVAPSESMSGAISDVGGLAILYGAVLVMAISVKSMDSGPLRDRWLLITMGVTLFAAGDTVWAYVSVVQGLEPAYPGLPDLFYIGEYAFLGFALLSAGLAYRGLVSPVRPAITAAAIALACAAALWWSFIGDLAFDAETAMGERALNVFYPMADVILLNGAALFTVLMIAKLGGGRLAWPWWSVAVGTIILSITNTMFAMNTSGYESGALIDVGWLLAHVAIAFGAVIAQDIAAPLRVVAVDPETQTQSA